MNLRVISCCGCCDLHTGSLIVGIFGIVFTIAGIITHSVALNDADDAESRTELKIFIGYSYLHVAINGLLIYGTIKESRYFLLPWLIFVGSGNAILSLVAVIFMFFAPVAIIIVIFCAAMWYVWICIWSYYLELNPTSLPSNVNIYAGATQITAMAPGIVTYQPQAPVYVEVGKGPEVV